MVTNERVISGTNKTAVLLWIAFAITAMVLMAYLDLFEDGLRGTLLFRSVGYLVYPIYYGCFLYLLHRMRTLLKNPEKYIYVTGDCLVLWHNRTMPLNNIREIYLRRNKIFLQELVVRSKDNENLTVKAYLLNRPAHDVVSELKELINLP